MQRKWGFQRQQTGRRMQSHSHDASLSGADRNRIGREGEILRCQAGHRHIENISSRTKVLNLNSVGGGHESVLMGTLNRESGISRTSIEEPSGGTTVMNATASALRSRSVSDRA